MSRLRAWEPWALALLRVVSALLFLEHGLMKLAHFPAGMPGPKGPLPPLLLAAGAIEVVGGILMTLGLFTRIAAFVCAGEMACAYFMAHVKASFWPAINQGDAAILFCFAFLYLVFAGAGACSIDSMVHQRKGSFQPA